MSLEIPLVESEELRTMDLDVMFKNPRSGITTHAMCPQRVRFSPKTTATHWDVDHEDIEDPSAEEFVVQRRLAKSDVPFYEIAPRLRLQFCFFSNSQFPSEYEYWCQPSADSTSKACLSVQTLIKYTGEAHEQGRRPEHFDTASLASKDSVNGLTYIGSPDHQVAVTDKNRTSEAPDHIRAEVLACFLSQPAYGSEFNLQDSDLPQRFPDVFPRFSNNDYSSLLRLPGDGNPSFLEYSSYEIPISKASSSQDANSALENEEELPAAKRAKGASDASGDTFTILAPTSRADFVGLPEAIVKLKEVALPTKSKIGFVVSLFGGVLHLSFPPSAEQLKLYSHVIHLYKLCNLSDDHIVATLNSTLTALQGPQIIPFTLSLPIIDEMFACIWIDCGQMEKLLNLLAPILSRPEDFIRIGQLIGSTVSLNFPAFVRFCAHRHEELIRAVQADEDHEIKAHCVHSNFKYHVAIRYPGLPWFRCDGFGSNPHDSELFYLSKESSNAATSLPLLDSSQGTTFRSTIDKDAAITAHLDLVYLRWPFIKRIIDSGFSESRTKVIELPISEAAIRAVLIALHADAVPVVSYEVALELLEHGPEIGLFDPSKLDALGLLSQISLSDCYDTHTIYLNPLVLECARTWIYADGSDILDSVQLGLRLNLPNLTDLLISSFKEWDSQDLTSVGPELADRIGRAREASRANKYYCT